jgi:hypothetical protein
MKWYGWLALFAVAFVVAVVIVLRRDKGDSGMLATPSGETTCVERVSIPRSRPAPDSMAVGRQGRSEARLASGGADRSSVVPVVARPEGEGEATARVVGEQAIERWDALVSQLVEQKEQPTLEQTRQVKEAFDKLDSADRKDSILHTLNLLPDDQFPVLYAILFDKNEPPDVLDAILSDALNRPEEIKNPLMQELRKDREHPLYFEAARILDVVEPEGAQDD